MKAYTTRFPHWWQTKIMDGPHHVTTFCTYTLWGARRVTKRVARAR